MSNTTMAIQRIRRGSRVAMIRDALHLTGEQMADLLRQHLAKLGIEEKWDKAKISRIENGTRDLSLAEGVVLAALDPEARGVHWLAVGAKADYFQTTIQVPRI